MVIDDDHDIRATLGALLEDEGYRTVLAKNGREALQLLRGGLIPRAIVLDLMMPVMDGWSFRAEQRIDPDLRDIPVVVLSASAVGTNAIRNQLGISECLRKPPQVDELLDVLANFRG